MLEQNPPAVIEALSGKAVVDDEPVVPLPKPKYEDPEIEVLSQHLGPFVEGMVLEVALSDMLQWLPRQRHKSDAYKSLVRRMKALGLQLRVGPQYKPKENGQ